MADQRTLPAVRSSAEADCRYHSDQRLLYTEFRTGSFDHIEIVYNHECHGYANGVSRVEFVQQYFTRQWSV